MGVTNVRARQVADELTHQDVAAANLDGAAGTPSLRTLGTGAQQAAAGSHASQHKHGGADEVATATAGANLIPKAGAGGKLAAGWLTEVLGLADLTDVSAVTGTGTTVALQNTPTLLTPVLRYQSEERYYPSVVSAHVDATANGAWVVHTPVPRTALVLFRLRVYGYAWDDAQSIDFTVVGYLNNSSSAVANIDGLAGAVQRYDCQDDGTDGLSKWVGIDAAGNLAVAFGTSTSDGQFWRVAADFWCTFTSTDYSAGWSVTQEWTSSNFGFKDLHGPLITPRLLKLGGTGADLSQTGGVRQVVKQLTAGASLEVGALAADELPAHASRHQHGGADEVASFNSGANLIPKASAGGRLYSGYLPDLPFVLIGPDANLPSGVAIPGLAGSADVKGAAGTSSTSEEFDTTDPFTWTPSSPTVTNVNSTIKNHWYAQAQDATERFALKAYSPGIGDVDARAHLSIAVDNHKTTGTHQFGLMIANSANTSRVLGQLIIDFANSRVGCQAYTYSGGAWTQVGATYYGLCGTCGYVRVYHSAGNVLKVYFSADGKLWQAVCANTSFTLAREKIGFRLVGQATGQNNFAASDWLRSNV